MATLEFKLPDVGEGVAEAEIVAWHVRPGERVEEDQPLVDVMTDKATVEITSPVTAKVRSLAFEPGVRAAIGSVVAVLEVEDEATLGAPREAALAPSATEAPLQAAAPPPARPRPKAPAAFALADLRPLASPAVRRRAQELGVTLSEVAGSGPAGRVTRDDLEAHLARPAPGPARLRPRTGVEEVPVIGLRRMISERMALAKRRIPHFSYVEEIDVTELERLRGELNARRQDRPKLTLLPFLIRAMVRALPQFPQINATFDDEAGLVRRHGAVHVGVATQTPQGLVVPVLRHAEALDLWSCAREVAANADLARSGKAGRELLSGSTITVTSLGALGGVATTPVINHPEVAILGPNRIVERPVALGGAVVVRKMMNLSSSFDHRVVDGFDAAEFVQVLKRLLETPALMFVEEP